MQPSHRQEFTHSLLWTALFLLCKVHFLSASSSPLWIIPRPSWSLAASFSSLLNGKAKNHLRYCNHYFRPGKSRTIKCHSFLPCQRRLFVRGGSIEDEEDERQEQQQQREDNIIKNSNSPVTNNLNDDESKNSNRIEAANKISYSNNDTVEETKADEESPLPPMNKQDNLLLSICSIQGKRPYMEDEYFTNQDGSFVAVFDGHGGKAISRYLRQNLYARYLQAKATFGITARTSRATDSSDRYNTFEEIFEPNTQMILDSNLNDNGKEISSSTSSSTTTSTKKNSIGTRIQLCVQALKAAFQKIDSEVNKISHWSFQGSTAVAILLLRLSSKTSISEVDAVEESITSSSTSVASISSSSSTIHNSSFDHSDNDTNDHQHEQNMQETILSSTQKATSNNTQHHESNNNAKSRCILISANVGDSRAIISRSGKSIDLTRDHKPNEPMERKRIENLGGKVVWCGPVHPKTGKPLDGISSGSSSLSTQHLRTKKSKSEQQVNNMGKRSRAASPSIARRPFTGIYRINGNLALSRAIGDRSEKPLISSEVEIKYLEVDDEKDEFIILASDGLWDVMSSQEAVDYCHRMIMNWEEMELHRHEKEWQQNFNSTSIKQAMAKYLVKEALTRGSMDNISVVIVWLL